VKCRSRDSLRLCGGSSPAGRLVDAANSFVLCTSVLNANVASFSPLRSPRVSHDPVVHVVRCASSIADSGNCVVSSLQACSGVDDSVLVRLERKLTGINTNSDGLLGNSRHQSIRVVFRNISVTYNVDTSLVLFFVFTHSSVAVWCVLVVRFKDKVDSVITSPCERSIVIATVASTAARLWLRNIPIVVDSFDAVDKE